MVSTASKKLIGFFMISLFLFHLPATPVAAQDIEWHTDFVNTLEWNHNGSLLASGSTDASSMVVDTNGVFQTFNKGTIGPNSSVLDVTWFKDSNILFTGDVSRVVFGWDINTSIIPPVYVFDRHNGFVKQVVVDPRSNDSVPVLVSGGDGSNVRYFAFKNTFSQPGTDFIELEAMNDHENDATIVGIEFSDSGQKLVVGDTLGFIRVYSVPNIGDDPTLDIQLSVGDNLQGIDMIGEDTLVVITTSSVQAYRLNSFSGIAASITPVGSAIPITCDTTCLNLDVEISPGEDKVAIAAHTKFQVYGFNNETGLSTTATFSLDTITDLGFEEETNAVGLSWHPDNVQLALAAGPDVLSYNTDTGDRIFRVEGEITELSNIVFIIGAVVFILIIVIFIVRRQLRKGSI